MSNVLTTIRRAFVVLLVAMLGIAFAQTAYADRPVDEVEGQSEVQSENEENGKAKHADDEAEANSPGKGKAASHGTSAQEGEYDEPQPLSSADQNDSGANVRGGYDSTRDGSPSSNGMGDGEATGQPCEACVGQADNKNPSGQDPHGLVGLDPNNGYECDGNHGIAHGNPAHSACEPALASQAPVSPETEVGGVAETPVPAGTAEVKGLNIVRETPVESPAPAAVEVLGIQEVRSAPAAEVLPAAEAAPAAVVAQPAGQSLPLTGANILVFLLIAAVVGTIGTLVTRMTGRKTELI